MFECDACTLLGFQDNYSCHVSNPMLVEKMVGYYLNE